MKTRSDSRRAVSRAPLRIRLGAALDAISFEHTYRKYRAQSLEASTVFFHAGDLASSNLFGLSLLLLWICELRSLGKTVTFSIESTRGDQRESRLRALLYRWRIIESLRHTGTEIVDHHAQSERAPSIEPSQRAIIGVHLFSDFRDLDDFLRFESEREAELFQDLARLELIGSGALRNIILRELILNVFEHGKGIFGITAMSQNKSPFEYPARAQSIISAAPVWEQQFLRSLKTSSYLEVVIADHGPGILKTLGPNWLRDSGKTTDRKTRELNVVEYAFGKHASSKTDPDEYLRVAIGRADGIPQTITGLYYVRELVAEHHGVISVRSGRSWLAWDFSRGPDPEPLSHTADRRTRTLADLEGVQYRILLPLGAQSSQASEKQNSLAFFDLANSSTLPKDRRAASSRDRFRSFLVAQSQGSAQSEDEFLVTICNKMRSSYQDAKSGEVFAVTLGGGINSKRLTLVLLYVLADIQIASKPIFIMALGESAPLVERASINLELLPSDLLILVFTSSSLLFLAGAVEEENKFVMSLVSPPLSPGDAEPNLPRKMIRRVRHLITHDEPNGPLRARPWLTKHRDLVLFSLSSYFQSWKSEPPDGIRHEGHFLLPFPSNAYCSYFWDVGEIAAQRDKLDATTIALAFKLQEVDPRIIVALSSNAGLIARSAVAWLQRQGRRSVDIHLIENPHTQLSFLHLATRAERARTLYLTDVIGTGKVVSAALAFEEKKAVIGVLSIVDAREVIGGALNGIDDGIEVWSLVAEPQKYFRDLPAAWSYASIQIIEPILHRPIASRPLELPPVLWGDDLDTSLQHCSRSDAVNCGHFSSGTRHFSTFILTARLVSRHCDEIVGAILAEVGRAAAGMPLGTALQIRAAVYNEASEAAARICAAIADASEECAALAVPLNVKRNRTSPPEANVEGHDVIVIEPAASTGDTARALLAYAAQLLPRNIFLFIIAERMPELDAWLLLNINVLNGAHVEARRFLSLSSGSYRLEDCPQCMLLSEYEQVILHASNTLLSNIAGRRVNRYSVVPISTFRDPQVAADPQRADLLWAETAMGSRLHAALNDLELRHRMAVMLDKGHEAQSGLCCGLILAIARETPLFRPQEGALRDVVYPTLETRLVQSCILHVNGLTVDAEVRAACFLILAELSLLRRTATAWWKSVQWTEEGIASILCEICRWALAGRRTEEALRGGERIFVAIEKCAARAGLIRHTKDLFRAARLILSYSHNTRKHGGKVDGPSAAWQVCSRLLKRHGHIAAALDSLIGTISPLRTQAELREYYEGSWVERVRGPIEEALLPSIGGLQQSRLPGVHSRPWPLAATTLKDLRRLLTEGERWFHVLLDGAPKGEVAFKRFLDEVQALRNILLGDDSAFLAVLRRLVVTEIRSLYAHFSGEIESLKSADIDCSLDLIELPPGRGIFASTGDLLTCTAAIVRNIAEHAFPHDFTEPKKASISSKIDSDRYLLEFKDDGIGFEGQVWAPANQDNGLETVKRFADAYGAEVIIESLKPGCYIGLSLELVDL